jgi:hypothetical protein
MAKHLACAENLALSKPPVNRFGRFWADTVFIRPGSLAEGTVVEYSHYLRG